MKRFTEFYKSHDRLTENVPFTNHKYFIVQMVAYIMVHVSSEQGKGVIIHSPPNIPQHSKDTQRVLSLLIIIYVISLTCVNTFITSNHIYISHEDKYNHKSKS